MGGRRRTSDQQPQGGGSGHRIELHVGRQPRIGIDMRAYPRRCRWCDALAGNGFDEGRVESDLANLDVAFLLGTLGQRTPKLSTSDVIRSQRGDPNTASDLLPSRNAKMYNPPRTPPRPFEADYPAGAPSDAEGHLTADIEGRPLTARWVVGRKVVGGEDQPLVPSQYDPLTKAAIGNNPASYSARELPKGTVGAYRVEPEPDGPVRAIGIYRGLPPEKAALVTAHEMGHMVDSLADRIPVEGIRKELSSVYNDLNNPVLAQARALNPDVDPAPHCATTAPKLRGT